MNINDIPSMYVGESKNLVVTVYKPDGINKENITGATFNWILNYRKSPVKKDSSTGGIVITDANNGVVTIKLYPVDTENLSGIFNHELEMTDQDGNDSIVLQDMLMIKQRYNAVK